MSGEQAFITSNKRIRSASRERRSGPLLFHADLFCLNVDRQVETLVGSFSAGTRLGDEGSAHRLAAQGKPPCPNTTIARSQPNARSPRLRRLHKATGNNCSGSRRSIWRSRSWKKPGNKHRSRIPPGELGWHPAGGSPHPPCKSPAECRRPRRDFLRAGALHCARSRRYFVFSKISRPMSNRRISLVPAPIS